MCRQHIATIGFIGLLAVLAVGCSRMTADEEHDVRLSFGLPADIPIKNLGVVELRVGIPKTCAGRLGQGLHHHGHRADEWLGAVEPALRVEGRGH